MAKNGGDILEALKFELRFLEDGGCGRSPQAPWRPPAIFEDSPICPNFSDPARPHPCDSCMLMEFVPEGRQDDVAPCRFIEIGKGQTIEDFYRTGTQVEVEEALGKWLRAQIKKIEQERGITSSKTNA